MVGVGIGVSVGKGVAVGREESSGRQAVHSNVIARRAIFPTKQSPHNLQIASGKEQVRPRNNIKLFIHAKKLKYSVHEEFVLFG